LHRTYRVGAGGPRPTEKIYVSSNPLLPIPLAAATKFPIRSWRVSWLRRKTKLG
jgi:hypothetical protein